MVVHLQILNTTTHVDYLSYNTTPNHVKQPILTQEAYNLKSLFPQFNYIIPPAGCQSPPPHPPPTYPHHSPLL